MILVNLFKYITNKYSLKDGTHIDINLINKIATTEKISVKDLQVLLQNVKDYTLIRTLGISVYSYKKMKFENRVVRIKDIKIKHTVDLIKVDLKYQ